MHDALRSGPLLARFLQAAGAALVGLVLVLASGCGSSKSIPIDEGGREFGGVVRFDPHPLNFGIVPIGQSRSATVTITNIGETTLNMTGLTLTGNAAFTATQPADLVLGVNQSTTFTVTFAPTVEDAVSAQATVSVVSPDTGDTLQINGGGQPPVFDIRPVDGGELDANGYDFGFIPQGSTDSVDIVITNVTGEVVTITPPLRFNQPSFSATEPDPLALQPGGTTTTSVTYRAITINRVCDSLLIDYTTESGVTGTASIQFCGGLEDELAVLGEGLHIVNGDSSPRAADLTDFGEMDVKTEESLTHEFTIFNNTAETVTFVSLTFASEAAIDEIWEISGPEDGALTPGATTEFSVTFTALQAGPHTAVVRLESDAPQNTVYTFTVQGVGLGPGIQIEGIIERYNEETGELEEIDQVLITDSFEGLDNPGHTPSEEDNTDFGMRPLGIPIQHRFRITNNGNAKLDLTNDNVVQLLGTNFDEWRVVKAPVTTIEVGASDDFILEFRSRFDRDRNNNGLLSEDDPGEATYPLPAPGDLDGFLVTSNVRIDSNAVAAVHDPFVFNLQGIRYRTALTVQAAPPPFPLDYRNPKTVPHGQQRATEANNTDFAGVQQGASVTHDFVLRNDYTEEIELTGSPVINIQGAHADDYTVTMPPQVVTGYLLQPSEEIGFSITFTPSDIGLRSATVTIANTDPFPDTDPYTFNIHGRGLGPRLKVYGMQLFDVAGNILPPSQPIEIGRDDKFPEIKDGTEMLPDCYIVDWPIPFATFSYYFITNVGNEVLKVGDGTGVSVEVQDLDEGTFFVFEQPIRIDAATLMPPLDENGQPMLELAEELEPGEWARFRIDFNPPIGEPLSETGRQPEENIRRGTVSIDTSDPPRADSADPDSFTFGIQGTAIDPDMEVLGQGELIEDLDFNPRIEDDTTYNDVDMWGGEVVHTFIVQNVGRTHPLLIGGVIEEGDLNQPYITHEETMYQAGYVVQEGGTILVPGVTRDWPTPHGGPYSETFLSRLRIGDTINGARVTYIEPWQAYGLSANFCGGPYPTRGAVPNPPFPEAIPTSPSNLHRPFNLNKRLIGSVTVDAELVPDSDISYAVFTKPAQGSDRRDTYVVNPASTIRNDMGPAIDIIDVAEAFIEVPEGEHLWQVIGGPQGWTNPGNPARNGGVIRSEVIDIIDPDNDGDFAFTVSLDDPFHSSTPPFELPEHPHSSLELLGTEVAEDGPDAFKFENDRATQVNLRALRPNCYVVGAGLDPADDGVQVFHVTDVDPEGGLVFVQEDLGIINIEPTEQAAWIRPRFAIIWDLINFGAIGTHAFQFELDPIEDRSLLNYIIDLGDNLGNNLTYAADGEDPNGPIVWNPLSPNPNSPDAVKGTDYFSIIDVRTEPASEEGLVRVVVTVEDDLSAILATDFRLIYDEEGLPLGFEAGLFPIKVPAMDVYFPISFEHFFGMGLSTVKKDFKVIGTLPESLNPGEIASFAISGKPRWSSGFDAPGGGRDPAARGFINHFLTELPANEDPATYAYGDPTYSDPEHQVEVNITNSDADTFHDWNEDYATIFPQLLPVPNDYAEDDVDPQYEFALHLVSRNPRLQLTGVTDGFFQVSEDGARPGQTVQDGGEGEPGTVITCNDIQTISFDRVAIGGQSPARLYQISNVSSTRSWTYDSINNALQNPGWTVGQAPTSKEWDWSTLGNLQLDEDEPIFMSGSNGDDFIIDISPAFDLDPTVDRFDPVYSLPVTNFFDEDFPTLPDRQGQVFSFTLRYVPRGFGQRVGFLNIATNDATRDPFVVRVVGGNPAGVLGDG